MILHRRVPRVLTGMGIPFKSLSLVFRAETTDAHKFHSAFRTWRDLKYAESPPKRKSTYTLTCMYRHAGQYSYTVTYTYMDMCIKNIW